MAAILLSLSTCKIPSSRVALLQHLDGTGPAMLPVRLAAGNAALEQDLLEIQGTNLKFPCSHHMNKARKCWHDFTVCQTHILFSLKCKRCACSPAQSVRIMKSRCRSSFKGCCFGITDRLGCLKSAPKLTLKNPYFKYGFIRVKYGLNTGYVRVWENRVFAQNQVFKI